MYNPYLCYNFANYFLFLLISVHQPTTPKQTYANRLFAISVDHHAHTIAVDCYDQRMVC